MSDYTNAHTHSTFLSSVRDLAVTLDSELTFADHISLLTRYCFYQLRRFRAIRRSVSPKVFLTIVHAFVCTCIDYCNSLLIGLPKTLLAPVQSVLNAAARWLVCHLTRISLTTWSMSWTLSQSLPRLDTRSCSWLLSP